MGFDQASRWKGAISGSGTAGLLDPSFCKRSHNEFRFGGPETGGRSRPPTWGVPPAGRPSVLDTTTPVGESTASACSRADSIHLPVSSICLKHPGSCGCPCCDTSEGGQISTAQDTLLTELCAHHGGQRLLAKPLFLRPAPPPQSRAAAAGGEEVCSSHPR
jgi:hypothetical protein